MVSPNAGLFSLESGPWFYERYFMHKWTRSLRRKQELFPGEELFSKAELKDNLRGLTRSLVLRHTDFGTLENYLDGYSIAGDTLASLRIPATILTAADDPVIPIVDFHALKLPPQVELDIAAHGGHCGFISDFALHSFTGDYIAERVLSHLSGVSVANRSVPRCRMTRASALPFKGRVGWGWGFISPNATSPLKLLGKPLPHIRVDIRRKPPPKNRSRFICSTSSFPVEAWS